MPGVVIDALWLLSLALIALIDAKKRIIPDALLLFGAALCLLQWFWGGKTGALYGIIAALCGFVFFLAVRFVGGRITGKEALGWGDVKFITLVGGYLGVYGLLVALLAGTLVGALFAVVMLAAKKLKRTDELPFGPALCLGAAVATLFGNELIEWYLGLLM